jgi:hypothetical protein
MKKEEKAERNHKNQIQRKNTVLAAEKMRANQEEEVVHEMIKEMKITPEKDLNPDQDHDLKPTRMKIVEIHLEETEIIKEVTVVVVMSEIEMMIEEEIMDQEEEEIILIEIVEEVIMREGMEIMNIEEDLEAIMVLEKEEIEEMITTMIITEEEETTEMIRIKPKRRVGVSLK